MLEISGRQTGKTQRMIEHILLHNRGNTVKVRTPNKNLFDALYKRFINSPGNSFFNYTNIEYTEDDFAEYYEEFDFIKFKDLDAINYKGYFCTTRDLFVKI